MAERCGALGGRGLGGPRGAGRGGRVLPARARQGGAGGAALGPATGSPTTPRARGWARGSRCRPSSPSARWPRASPTRAPWGRCLAVARGTCGGGPSGGGPRSGRCWTRLSFTAGRANWGLAAAEGAFEVTERDFDAIAEAMARRPARDRPWTRTSRDRALRRRPAPSRRLKIAIRAPRGVSPPGSDTPARGARP